MANTNLTGNGTLVFDSRLWGGVGEADTSWLQSPMGSNSVTGTISMAVVDVVITDGDAAAAYDLALSTNAVTGSEDEHYQMDYSKLVTHLVKGMKEQQEQIEFLKEEIANLKGE